MPDNLIEGSKSQTAYLKSEILHIVLNPKTAVGLSAILSVVSPKARVFFIFILPTLQIQFFEN